MMMYQQGAGIGRIYVGAPYQQGAGIGSFLGGVFRYVLPLLKRSAKVVGKEALQAGVDIMSDVGERKTPFKEAFKARQSGENLQQKAKENLDKFMHGDGYKVRLSNMPAHLALALARAKKKKKCAAKKTDKRLRRKIKKKKKKNRRPKKQDFVDIFK